ncbi:putative disease resistance protein [Vitis vinifera]|uniref:Putative disease resistance protein n=1 Tax=Vitis vinifera TaxID=29760 RepID=A0A438FQD4_VITVI|nr:putative disease resistance protein [Vitis vinifera]
MASLRVPSISELVMIDYGKLQLKRPNGGFTSLQTSDIQISDISQWKQLPAGLQHLQIIKCDSAETLLEERILQTNSCFLKFLVINSCSFIRCFHRVGLPTTLKTLHIYRSTKLDFLLPELFKGHLPFLEQFRICYGSCESLSLSFSLGAFPRLTHLIIDGLEGLENLSIGVLEGISHLSIWGCSKLKLLAHNSSSLKRLILKRCPELLFQRGGLPSNLCALEIWDCDKLTPLVDLGLQMLVSLTHFTFKGGWEELESLPKDCPLPSILTTLKLENVSNLKSLDSMGLQQLTSLTNLSIYYCPELHSSGEEGLQHLTSLEELQISGCPALLSLIGWCAILMKVELHECKVRLCFNLIMVLIVAYILSYILLRWIDVYIVHMLNISTEHALLVFFKRLLLKLDHQKLERRYEEREAQPQLDNAQRKSVVSVIARISGHPVHSSTCLSTCLSFLNIKNCLGLMNLPQYCIPWANALRIHGRLSLEPLMIISSKRLHDSLLGTLLIISSKRHVSFQLLHPNTPSDLDAMLKGLQNLSPLQELHVTFPMLLMVNTANLNSPYVETMFTMQWANASKATNDYQFSEA